VIAIDAANEPEYGVHVPCVPLRNTRSLRSLSLVQFPEPGPENEIYLRSLGATEAAASP
jgi:hypothetical protein